MPRPAVRNLVIFSDQYLWKVLRTRPASLVACWPIDDAAGTVARDAGASRLNGTHTGVALGQPGIGDGRSSGLYDGATRFTNVYSAGLALNPANEMINNGGMETAGATPPACLGWTDTVADGAVARTTAAGEFRAAGGGSAAVKVTAGATRTTKSAQNYVAIPGSQVTIVLWARGDGVNGGSWDIRDATHGAPISGVRALTTGAAFASDTYTFTVPAGCVLLSIDLYNPNAAGGWACFDDVSCKPATGYGYAGFSGSEGTLMCWPRVANAGVWTDGASRLMVKLRVDANNDLSLYRSSANNRIGFDYTAGGTYTPAVSSGNSDLGWMHWAAVWSASGNYVRIYRNGVQIGADVTGLGKWIGTLGSTTSVIGAASTVPAAVWNGWLAYPTLWNAALTAAEIQSLARV